MITVKNQHINNINDTGEGNKIRESMKSKKSKQNKEMIVSKITMRIDKCFDFLFCLFCACAINQ